jgi:uncharacterized protein (TIGR03435 family)
MRRTIYDVSATSLLSRATADRVTMMRSMLTERFTLVVHIEQREQPTFDLVLARRDGRLGPGLTQSATECSDVPPHAHHRSRRAPDAELAGAALNVPELIGLQRASTKSEALASGTDRVASLATS